MERQTRTTLEQFNGILQDPIFKKKNDFLKFMYRSNSLLETT